MKRLVPALLACSAAIATPVDASTHYMDSSASLTGLQFELIDLRPDAGITPALQVAGKAFVRARAGYGCPFAECREAAGTAFSSELLVHAGDSGARPVSRARAWKSPVSTTTPMTRTRSMA